MSTTKQDALIIGLIERMQNARDELDYMIDDQRKTFGTENPRLLKMRHELNEGIRLWLHYANHKAPR